MKMRADYVPTEYDIFFDEEYQTTLNKNLVQRQGVYDNLNVIKTLHVDRIRIENEMKALMPDTTANIKKLRDFNMDWMNTERELQRAWKFEQNDNYIRFWNVPHCECPKLDNEDNYPHGYYTKNCGCPIHGSGE